MIYSEIDNFDHTKADLIAKWGRISSAVQWCYQNRTTMNTGRKDEDTQTQGNSDQRTKRIK